MQVEAFHAFRRADSANLLPLRELQQSVYVLVRTLIAPVLLLGLKYSTVPCSAAPIHLAFF